jgi:hypothetical protein
MIEYLPYCPICYRSWEETNCSNFENPHSWYDVVEFLIKDREIYRIKFDTAMEAINNIAPDGDGPVYMQNYNYDIAQEAKAIIENIK